MRISLQWLAKLRDWCLGNIMGTGTLRDWSCRNSDSDSGQSCQVRLLYVG